MKHASSDGAVSPVHPSPKKNQKKLKSPTSPRTTILQLVMGRWTAQMIGMAAELGLADQIQTGPKTVEELAVATGLHAPSLYRLLRALANFQIFAEQEDGCFVQTQCPMLFAATFPTP